MRIKIIFLLFSITLVILGAMFKVLQPSIIASTLLIIGALSFVVGVILILCQYKNQKKTQ